MTRDKQAFTLVEMLTVIAIITLLLVLALPSVTSLKGSRDITKSTFDLVGALELARTYALANNTYVWVGFFEEDGSKNSTVPATAGNGGRLVISVVASQDGTRYSDSTISATLPAAFGAGDTSNTVSLTQVAPLMKLSNVHMAAVNNGGTTGNNPNRPGVPTSYQIGDTPPNNAGGPFAPHSGSGSSNPTTFTYPLKPGGTAQYTFSKIIEFSPQGEASKIAENVFSGPGLQNAMEIAVQPTHGAITDPRYTGTLANVAAAAVQIEGITGQVRVYRP